MTKSPKDILNLPPQNIEAEKSFLGSILVDNKSIHKVIDLIGANDFYERNHQIVYDAMLQLTERRENIDVLTLSNKLSEMGELNNIGGASYLTGLVNSVPTAAHIKNYGEIIKRKKVLRELISTSHEIIELSYNEEEEIDALLDRAEQKLFSISQNSQQQNFVAVPSLLQEAFDRLDKLHKGDGTLRGLSTGFMDLDNMLAGLQKSDLLILAARPSLGKTALALDLALNVARKNKATVGIFSLEMSKSSVIDRLLASEASVSLWKLRTGKLSMSGDHSDLDKISGALDTISKYKIFVDDSPSPNILQMRAMARRLQAEHGLDLLIVDYLQLVRPSRFYASPVQEITEISRSLKALARELDIPVIALSQLSRAVESRTEQRPKLSDLRDSGCLAGDTLIVRADTGERIPIKNLAGQKNIPVFSLNKENKIEIRKISKVFSSGIKKLYEIRTKNGQTIKASANHPFLRIDGWNRLDQLKTGEYIAKILNSKTMADLANSDIFWDQIVSIIPLGREEVFDATVPGTHNFVANDFIVHNSIEQDADVVLFIYREDVVKGEKSQKPNIAEIIIAKQRNGPTGHIDLFFDLDKTSFKNLAKTMDVPEIF